MNWVLNVTDFTAVLNTLSFLQTAVGKSGWINLEEDAADLVECSTGEKLLTDWKLFRYCNDPFMIQCLETDCTSGKNVPVVKSIPFWAINVCGHDLKL